jgi:hypothetical protein
MGGSSEAAPVVAGVLGLMFSVNPYLSAQDLRRILIDTASCNPVNTPLTGVGRVDALKAIRNASGAPRFDEKPVSDGEHPTLHWAHNQFFTSSTIEKYIIQKRRQYETCFQDLDSVSGATTSHTDVTEIVPEFWVPSYDTHYRIRARVVYGNSAILSVPSKAQTIGTDPAKAKIPEQMPTATRLLNNYPNPFNPTTTIRFDIAEPAFVSLRVYDVLGREVSTLVNDVLQPGTYSKRFEATSVSSGVYFCRMNAGVFVETSKLLVSK